MNLKIEKTKEFLKSIKKLDINENDIELQVNEFLKYKSITNSTFLVFKSNDFEIWKCLENKRIVKVNVKNI